LCIFTPSIPPPFPQNEHLGTASDKAWVKKQRARTPKQIAKERKEEEKTYREEFAEKEKRRKVQREYYSKLAKRKGKAGSLKRIWG
jgi:hypothetical protein